MPAARRILLLTRDAALGSILPRQLALGGEFEAEVLPPEAAETRLAEAPRPDAILLDADAPPGPAHWCAGLAGRPLLLLGQGPDEAQPGVLPTGASGRVAKPLRLNELLPRLHTLLAAFDASPAAAITIGSYAFHPAGRLLLGPGELRIRLTEKEAAILLHLHQAGGRAVSREELLGEVWGYARGVTTHTLETHVYRLRRKLDTMPGGGRHLRTEEGGYRLVPPDARRGRAAQSGGTSN